MKLFILLSFTALLYGCSSHKLTIEKVGDGLVFPFEGTREVTQSNVEIIATENYGPYKFHSMEGVDTCSINTFHHMGYLKLNSDKKVTVTFTKVHKNINWLNDDYILVTPSFRHKD